MERKTIKRILALMMMFTSGVVTPMSAWAAETPREETVYVDMEEEDVGEILSMDDIDEFFEGTHYLGEEYEQQTVAGPHRAQASSGGQWIQDGTRWWYQYSDGSYPKNGWAEIDGRRYLFDASGWMLVDWQEFQGQWYYLWPTTSAKGPMGSMATGWIELGDNWYYLYEKINCYEESPASLSANLGQMLTGWVKTGGVWYYCDTTGGGQWIPKTTNQGIALISEATQHFSTPYVWGGANWATGVDCSGFTMLVTKSVLNISLPHNSASQYNSSKAVSLAQRKPGDLEFFCPSSPNTIGHVAFYMGTIAGQDGYVIQAEGKNKGITIARRTDVYKICRYWN
ncbi:MAG: C40 family peptidase [Lachnospiraceae bacterium]|nr:C40 family peptidase [Lachnospiraceae bacterium]